MPHTAHLSYDPYKGESNIIRDLKITVNAPTSEENIGSMYYNYKSSYYLSIFNVFFEIDEYGKGEVMYFWTNPGEWIP